MSKEDDLFGGSPGVHLHLRITDQCASVAHVDGVGHTVVRMYGKFGAAIIDLSPTAATRLQEILANPEPWVRLDQPLRMTIARQVVLRTMLDRGGEMYGLQIAIASGVKPGSVYQLLARLVDAGWLERRDETDVEYEPESDRRPRRRYYWVPSEVVHQVRKALNEASSTPA